jgi:hypothetical protein
MFPSIDPKCWIAPVIVAWFAELYCGCGGLESGYVEVTSRDDAGPRRWFPAYHTCNCRLAGHGYFDANVEIVDLSCVYLRGNYLWSV